MVTPSLVWAYWMRGSMAGILYASGLSLSRCHWPDLECNGPCSLPSLLIGETVIMSMDFNAHDIGVRAVLAEKDREARAMLRASEAQSAPQGLRAVFAGRLARLALRLDREAARSWLSREGVMAGMIGAPRTAETLRE